MIEIDLSSHELLECYSFSRAAWVELSVAGEPALHNVRSASRKKFLTVDERRIGPAPADGEADVRKIWKPPFIEEGQRLHHIAFDVFSADWPKDDSELSGNGVSLYFDSVSRCPFPVWIQIDTAHASVSSHMIDSGKICRPSTGRCRGGSPNSSALSKKSKADLRLSLKSPKYYRSFELYAVDT